MPIIYLDSNIYRQSGLRFIDNIDYKNLSEILETSGNDFGLLEIVYLELMDYFKNDIFDSILSDHEKLWRRYQANPYLDDIAVPDTTVPLRKAAEHVSEDLKKGKFFTKLTLVPPSLLLDFLLHNKRQAKKDNTRDFLIFFTLCELCKEHGEDYLVLISDDKIFTTNLFFKSILIRERITNLRFYNSIPDFLKDFGPKLDFVTSENISKNIDYTEIERELLNDVKCFPSYVSQFYYNKTEHEVPDAEKLNVNNVGVENFYIIKDYKTEKLKLNVTLKVDVKIVFKPEENKAALEAFLNDLVQQPYSKYTNLFDQEGRPIFNNSILFIVEGGVDATSKKIEKFSFVDFIPDYFIIEGIHEQLSTRQFADDKLLCQHDFDTAHGYWKNSRYDGGLSWHYRCRKCGLEYDTGDYYE